MEVMIAYFVWSQVVLVPILGGFWLGILNERKKKEALFRRSLSAIRVIGGRHGH